MSASVDGAASGHAVHEQITVIESGGAWRWLDLRELWQFRELFWVLAARDVKVRYKQTVLGVAWAVLRPVLTMTIFSVIFGRLAKVPSDGVPYPLFVFAALLPWTFFATAAASAGQSLVGSAHMVSKIYFPRVIIPVSATGVAFVDFLVSLLVLLLMMAWYGVGWSGNLLALPLLVVGLTCAGLGFGLLLSALTVTFRDFTHVTPFVLQIWMYATPVIFPASLVPERWRWLLQINPLCGLIEGFRSAFLGRPFDAFGLAISSTIAVAVLLLGVAYFRRVEATFADVI